MTAKSHLYDYLRDIVSHTHSLGLINLVKVTGTESETTLSAFSEDRSVVVQATTNKVIPDFVDTIFGMPNLNKLNIILNIPEYKEGAKLHVERKKDNTPIGIHFENSTGDFINDYRFMAQSVVEDLVKTIKFRGAKWDITFEPTNSSIQRMRYMASANSEEQTFSVIVNNGKLTFKFGDHSTHAGNFVFTDGVTGKLSKQWAWPAGPFLAILGLDGDKVLRISDEGAAMITVNSGLINYEYILPAQVK